MVGWVETKTGSSGVCCVRPGGGSSLFVQRLPTEAGLAQSLQDRDGQCLSLPFP